MEEVNDGLVNSLLNCENNCLHKEYTDIIDDSTSFTRKEDCPHYSIKMVRKKRQRKITFLVIFVCKKCEKSEKKFFDNIIENKCEFECCGQKKILFSFSISLKEEKNLIKDDSLISEEIKNKDINSNNIIFNKGINENFDKKSQNLITDESLIVDNEKEKSDYNIQQIDIYPWANIANENKITLKFKYFKKIGVDYHIHCSKSNYFYEVMKEFEKEINIHNFKFAISDSKRLDGEKTIKELELKDNCYVLVR